MLPQEAALDHVSVSSLTTYLRCPRLFEFRYITRTPPSHRPVNLVFGSAVHSALAAFYERHSDGTEIGGDELERKKECPLKDRSSEKTPFPKKFIFF